MGHNNQTNGVFDIEKESRSYALGIAAEEILVRRSMEQL